MQYRRLLSGAGIRVVVAHSHAEANEFMYEQEFAVVYMDPVMKNVLDLNCLTEFRDWESQVRRKRQLIVGLISSPSAVCTQSLLKSGFDNVEWKTNSKEGILKYVWSSWMQ